MKNILIIGGLYNSDPLRNLPPLETLYKILSERQKIIWILGQFVEYI